MYVIHHTVLNHKEMNICHLYSMIVILHVLFQFYILTKMMIIVKFNDWIIHESQL